MRHWHKLLAVALVSVVISLFSFYAFCQKLVPDQGLVCDGTCDVVQTSAYGYVYGIPVSLLGGFAFLLQACVVIFYIYYPHKLVRLAADASYIIAPLGALVFIGIQAFVLHAWCEFCLVVDFGAILTGVAWWAARLTERKHNL